MEIYFYITITESLILLGFIILFGYKLVKRKKSSSNLFNLGNLNVKPIFKFKAVTNKNMSMSYKVLLETSNFGIYYFKLRRIKRHKHTLSNALLYIVKGHGIGVIGNKHINAKSGDAVFVPANIVHEWKINKTMEYFEFISPSLKSTNFGGDTVWL